MNPMLSLSSSSSSYFARRAIFLGGLAASLSGAFVLACEGEDVPADPNADGAITTPTPSATSSAAPDAAVTLPEPKDDPARDILTTRLALDFATLSGIATLTLAESDSTGLSLAVGDLTIQSVKLGASGPALRFATSGKTLTVGVPARSREPIVIAYRFRSHDEALAGYSAARANTWLWPTHCQNLFPCKTSPADGVKFELEVTGLPPENAVDGGVPDAAAALPFRAVYPSSIPVDSPSYVPAFAFGRYAEKKIGTTKSGVDLVMWWRPGTDNEANVDTGVSRQLWIFDYFEEKYGPYAFGKKAGGVVVDWPSYGGMEHHPYWHVNATVTRAQTVGNHELGHAWFGDGVRPACAEDFALSEGTTTYITGHALEKHPTPPVPAIFDKGPYCAALQRACGAAANTVIMPSTCGAVDLSNSDEKLGGEAAYYKGAYFYYEVAQAVGADKLDAMLGSFYKANVGKAKRMEDMVAHLKAESGAAATVEQLANAWLRQLACPARASVLCPAN